METDYKGYTISIEQDQDPISPREDEAKMSVMALFHNRYNLGDDDHGYKTKDYANFDAMAAGIRKKEKDVVLMVPVWLLDHSGLTISTGPFASDGQQWDSGQIGWAFVTKRKIRENYAVKRVTKVHIERANKELLGEIDSYDKFLRGDFCYYSVKNEEGEVVDSCSGFQNEDDALNEAKSWVDAQLVRENENKEVVPA